MAKNNPIIGYMDCPTCKEIWDRQTTVAIQLQSEGKGMASYICDGRADPEKANCSDNHRFGSATTIKLKATFAKADRAPDPKPETETNQNKGADDGTASEHTGSGKEDDFLTS